uniref:THIF-type NAD/FAD binding fold domain-containing protein n=1 Tax=Meloidogyne javanica TaxID=6303 RepID=A0A915M875_MELJA
MFCHYCFVDELRIVCLIGKMCYCQPLRIILNLFFAFRLGESAITAEIPNSPKTAKIPNCGNILRGIFESLRNLLGEFGISTFYVDKNDTKNFKPVEPFKFELSQQLEKKFMRLNAPLCVQTKFWKVAIEDSIPTFVCAFTGMDDYKVEVICLVDAVENKNLYFQLPKIPKSIEEMKIVYCFLQQLFACSFEIAYLDKNVIFNPKLIGILFEEKKELVSQKIKISLGGSLQDENFSSFALNHLVSEEFFVQLPSDNIRRNINIAFNILTNGGNKFSKIVYRSYWAQFTRAMPNFPVLPIALAAEILKSLVLAGVGYFHIIDNSIVKTSDLGQNFFLDVDSVGKLRGECLVKLLTELNPSVHGQHSPVPFGEFSKHEMFMLLNFSLVIGTNMLATEAIKLDKFLFENNIPFLFVKSVGMLGYLRIDSPFPELLKLANETDLNSMTHEQHSHTPYVLHSINQNIEEMEEGGNKLSFFPNIKDYKTRKEIEKILLEMRQPDDKGRLDEENFMEATRNLLKSLGRTKVPSNVSKVLDDPKINSSFNVSKYSKSSTFNLFWLFCSALNKFISKYGHMPISGQLPDMTSDSKRYAQLLGIYREKSFEDAQLFYNIIKEMTEEEENGDGEDGGDNEENSNVTTDEEELSRIEDFSTARSLMETSKEFSEEHLPKITLEQCKNFCKNASKIAVQYGTSLSSEFNGNILKSLLQKIEPPRLDELPPVVDPLTWYILLRVVDRFQEVNGRVPKEENDLREMKRILCELLGETKDSELIKKQEQLFPDQIIVEICRLGVSELHVISAIIGGVAAQEAIKLCTNQYIPVDNSLIYDGNSQNATSFKN